MLLRVNSIKATKTQMEQGNSIILAASSMSNISNVTIDLDLRESSATVLCGLSSVVLLCLCILIFLHQFRIVGDNLMDRRTSSILFLLGTILTTVTGICSANSALYIYRIYLFVILIVVGLIFATSGACLFFESSPTFLLVEQVQVRRQKLGDKHNNIGIIIWLITIPLAAVELFLLVANIKEMHTGFYTSLKTAGMLQKLTQASVYYFSLRHRYPRLQNPVVSQWYFNILSFMNFVLWVDSILLTHEDDKYVIIAYSDAFSIFKAAYNALLIDYRLMCCLIFLEHSFEIESLDHEEDIQRPVTPTTMTSVDDRSTRSGAEEGEMFEVPRTTRIPYVFSHQISCFAGTGYLLGLTCIGMQIINGMQYMKRAGPWASSVVMVTDVLFIGGGIIFLKVNNLKVVGKWRHSDSKAIDAMVGILGGVGFIFWVLKSFLTLKLTLAIKYAIDARLHTYLAWTAAKFSFRATGMLFQLYMFMRVPPNICARRANRGRLANHFLVPTLLLSLMALFISSVVDEYHGDVEKLLEKASLDPSIRFLLAAGGPMELGFCLHMCLHFLIIRHAMVTARAHITYHPEESSAPEQFGHDPTVRFQSTGTPLRRTATPLTEPLISSRPDDDS